MHTVAIEEPPPACDTPLADLTLNGPLSGATGRTYTFSAVSGPNNADTPITFTWEATGQAPVDDSGSETLSEMAWTWNTTGSKQITVTAENCGASFVRHHSIEVVTQSMLPDLVPGELWYDAYQGIIGYIVRNDGQNAAAAGHNIGLYWDSLQQASATTTETIPGGGIRAGTFGDATSGCTGDARAMTVRVDDTEVIDEGQESNNDYTASWPCDLKIP